MNKTARTEEDDPLYDKAVALAHERKRLKYADVQRALFIGFNRAGRLLEEMERRGVMQLVPTERGGYWELLANTEAQRAAEGGPTGAQS